MMHLLDAVGREPRIRYVCNHHEQASAMAAEGYARQKGALGVCYATSGPGGTNTLTGIVGAYLDSSPLLVVTGQSKRSQTLQEAKIDGLRQFGVFEVDIVPIVKPVTKDAVFLNDPSRVRYELERLIHLAVSGRPGPVLLDVPLDVQGALIDPESLEGYIAPESPRDFPDIERAAASIELKLSAAERPIILAGHGIRVANASSEFAEFVNRVSVPVVTTSLAKDLLDYANPHFVGHPGPKGDRPGNFAVQTADVIIALGCSMHVSTTGFELDEFAPGAYIIQVDVDKANLLRPGVNVAEKYQCDTRLLLSRLCAGTSQNQGTKTEHWLTTCQTWKNTYSVQNEPHKIDPERISYYRLVDQLSEIMGSDATLVTDAGSAYYVVGQAFRTKLGQRVIVSGGLGTMGFALPASIGAHCADTGRLTVCLTGDGSLQSNLHELQCLSHNGFPVKVVVASNNGYQSIRNTQANFFDGKLAGASNDSGVSMPCLEKLAEGFSIPYTSCSRIEELSQKLSCLFSTEGPALLEVFTDERQQIIPTVASRRLEDGTMKSQPLHNMFPYLPDAELKKALSFE